MIPALNVYSSRYFKAIFSSLVASAESEEFIVMQSASNLSVYDLQKWNSVKWKTKHKEQQENMSRLSTFISSRIGGK